MKPLLVGVILCLLSIGANAQPVNDNCSGATGVALGSNVVDTGGGATSSGVASSCVGAGVDAWYVLSSTCNGTTTASITNNAGVDNVIAVYDSCGFLTELTCSFLVAPTVTFPTTTGEDYLIQIRGFTVGAAFLDLSCAPPDECADAAPVFEGSNVVTTNGATISGAPSSCFGSSEDSWYTYTPTCTGLLDIELVNLGGATNVYAVYDSCLLSIELDCQSGLDLSSTIPVIAGEDYIIQVWAFTQGDATLQLDCRVPDTCSEALQVNDGANTISTFGTTSSGVDPSCVPLNVGGGIDSWYRYTATCTGNLELAINNLSGADNVFAVYDACFSLNEIECNPNNPAVDTIAVSNGEDYLIQIRAFATGNSTLTITCQAPDECFEATPLPYGQTFVSTVGSTDSGTSPTCGGSSTNDIWYRFTALCSGDLTIAAAEAGAGDHLLALYDDCTLTNQIDCSNAVAPSLVFFATAGDEYVVQLRAFTTGQVVLDLECAPPISNVCVAPIPVQDGTNIVSTIGATDSAGGASCFGPRPESWYLYTASCSGTATFSITNLTADNVLAFYDDCTLGVEIDCDQNVAPVVSFPVIAGEDYVIQVGAFLAGLSELEIDCGGGGGASFIRGDLNEDTIFGLTDVIGLLGVLFSGSSGPGCLDTADINADGVLSLPDVIGLLNFLFSGGAPPSAPHPTCGTAPAGSPTVGCAASNSNCP